MGNLSEHFSNYEFTCPDNCGFDAVAPELVARLEVIRKHFNAPVRINSGCRCAAHNKRVGGAPGSQHIKGTAADIMVSGVLPNVVADFIAKTWPRDGGMGRYNTFTHIDVRPTLARWDYRK